ncbi:MAG: maleylpyruvate isomerase family mycothiol-dependent enzyme [Actinomycetota bacterium]
MRHPLTDSYRRGRERLLALGATLTDGGSVITTACPDWSVKDVFAHLAGISTDIINGNTEGAATEAWADGHVADRRERGLDDVLAEWAESGAAVSEVMESMGEVFPFQLFVDQYTHEWDIRAAIGPDAAARPDLATYEEYFDTFVDAIGTDGERRGLDRLELDVDGRRLIVGTGADVGTLPLSLFEFSRLTMGRRSTTQIAALPWPMADIDGHVDVIVRWSVNAVDVVDPVVG